MNTDGLIIKDKTVGGSVETTVTGPKDKVRQYIKEYFYYYPPMGYGTNLKEFQKHEGDNYIARLTRYSSCD